MTRVKVKTSELLKAVEKRKDEFLNDQQEKITRYPALMDNLRADAIDALRAEIFRLEHGENPHTGYDGKIQVPAKLHYPSEPTIDTVKIDRLIKTLQMSSEESISIDADDAAQYLG